MAKTAVNTGIIEGLFSTPKFIPSKYFYDAKGDEIFQQIMEMPEYYLTRAEYEILAEQSGEIVDATDFDKNTHFEIVELGAGDGLKTHQFLAHLLDAGFDFTYRPIDISPHVLTDLERNMKDLEGLKIEGITGDYFEVLDDLKNSKYPKLLLFLGSNLGNYEDTRAAAFLQGLSNAMNPNDALLLGLDLKKDPTRILLAYDDPAGITREFNLNLLTRINRELKANFNRDKFEHAPQYAPEGKAISYLVSLENQTVQIGETGDSISFKKGERIRTEVSRKYDEETLKTLLPKGLKVCGQFTDTNGDFSDFLICKS